MGILRIHTCFCHQDGFLVYQAIVRSRPSSHEIFIFQPSVWLKRVVSAVWRKTWPGRSPTRDMFSWLTPMRRRISWAMLKTVRSTPLPTLKIRPCTFSSGACSTRSFEPLECLTACQTNSQTSMWFCPWLHILQSSPGRRSFLVNLFAT